MPSVRYEFRIRGLMSDRVRDAFSDMTVQPVPAQSIIHADLTDETQLRELLSLCDALGLKLISLQQLPPHPPAKIVDETSAPRGGERR